MSEPLNAGERKEALTNAGFAVDAVQGLRGPTGMVWTYLPIEAVASPEARTLIESFDEPPDLVPLNVTAAQARLVLNATGLRFSVESAIAASSQDVKDYWEYSAVIERNHPVLLSIATTLDLSSEQLDTLFRQAAQIS
jgi:hypothetical protein